MSAEKQQDEICVVCCREFTIYAAGACDHVVCYECSTRMRVLCEQNECPICRGFMPYVIFTHKKQLFPQVLNFELIDRRYRIAFEDEGIQNAFKELLKHSCKQCGEVFATFDELSTHVRRQHSMHYCELCVQNLKIFTFERKCYSRRDLAHHKRMGDVDDTSHRGHPLCEFCEQRFVDHDERFRHLRREHYFCHFCDADGRHQFYNDYTYLKAHFRKEHYLCEEDECADEKFIGAFRTEIDYKAHVALNHTRNKSKAEVRQARTLGLEFNFVPRSHQNGDSSPNASDYRRRYGNQGNQRKRNVDEYPNREAVAENSENARRQQQQINTQCVQEFPLLTGEQERTGSGLWGMEGNRYSSSITGDNYQSKVQPKTKWRPTKGEEDFPALGPSSSEINSKKGSPSMMNGVGSHEASRGRTQSGSPHKREGKSAWSSGNRNVEKASVIKGPSTQVKTKSKSAGWGTRKMANSEEDFPRLEVRESANSAFTAAEPTSQPEPQWPVRVSAQDADAIAQQIYEKVRSVKEKEKNAKFDKSPASQRPKQKDAKLPKQPALSEVYSGLSAQNLTGSEENEDPLEIAKNKFLSYERPKKMCDDDDEWTWREKHTYIPEHFPPLETARQPKCPPGFSSGASNSHAPPPPGFADKLKAGWKNTDNSISLKSAANQLSPDDDSDDVNHNAHVENERNTSEYSYLPPTDFHKRNDMLIDSIYKLADSDNNSFDEFKLLSGKFRSGRITASEYHSQCLAILGKERFQQLFTELLCLLPDIEQQQALLAVHNRFLKEDLKNRGAVPKRTSTNSACSVTDVTVCPTCRQVLTKSDFPSHLKQHRNRPK